MASTNKTPKLGLNQWAAGDTVLRADFNADNAKIEAAVMVAQAPFCTGSYDGNDVYPRSFNIGFRPKLLIIYGGVANQQGPWYIVQDTGRGGNFGGGGCIMQSNSAFFPYLTDTGFTFEGNTSINRINGIYEYIAFR